MEKQSVIQLIFYHQAEEFCLFWLAECACFTFYEARVPFPSRNLDHEMISAEAQVRHAFARGQIPGSKYFLRSFGAEHALSENQVA